MNESDTTPGHPMLHRRSWTRQCSGVLLGLLSATLGGPTAAQGAPGSAHNKSPRILVVGDSLSAEYGIARGSGWVALLAERLATEQPTARVVNASISGDTTAGGRARLPALLAQHQPTLVVIELGGNDALRGLPVAHTRENLTAMVRAAQTAKAKVLLVGMQVPPNYGTRYSTDFAQVFQDVARTEKTALVPFLLSAFADRPDAESWFQPDRIHPLAKAHPLMLDTVWPVLRRLLPAR